MKDLVFFMPIKINSTRVKNKSIKTLDGRPLFCWSLETLDKLGVPIYVFSSDCNILKQKLDFNSKNIFFLDRDKRLDYDDVVGIQIYKEFKKLIPSKNYILTHCTSPFIELASYQKAIDLLFKDNFESIITVKKIKTFCWYNDKKINFSLPRQKTQDLLPVLVETSGMYGYKYDVLDSNSRSSENCKLVELSDIEAIDIDDDEDFRYADIIINYIKQSKNND